MTNPNFDYQKLYDRLYEEGYHSDLDYSHAKEICDWIENNIQFSSILDVGCSHGWVIRRFPDRYAWGVDVSEAAIQLAHAAGSMTAIRGSAIDLPFPSDSFDIVLSTDCIEHLTEADADLAAKEMLRVARRWVIVKPSPRPDRARWKEIAGHNLHLTVKPIQWWLDTFVEFGGQIVHEGDEWFVMENGVQE